MNGRRFHAHFTQHCLPISHYTTLSGLDIICVLDDKTDIRSPLEFSFSPLNPGTTGYLSKLNKLWICFAVKTMFPLAISHKENDVIPEIFKYLMLRFRFLNEALNVCRQVSRRHNPKKVFGSKWLWRTELNTMKRHNKVFKYELRTCTLRTCMAWMKLQALLYILHRSARLYSRINGLYSTGRKM